jgi:hypothetical protein
MKAITLPKKSGSAKWEEVQEPAVGDGSILVETIAVEFAERISRLSTGNTNGRRPARHASYFATKSLARVLELDLAG